MKTYKYRVIAGLALAGLLLVACGARQGKSEERLLDFDEVEMTLTADAGSVPTAIPQTAIPQSESLQPESPATAMSATPAPTALPQAAAPTPVPPPPTPTPTTAVSQSTEPTRIRFAPGAISVTETGSVAANGTDAYVLYALEGQTMTASVSSPSNQVLLSITGLGDGIPLVRTASDARSWTGVLPGTQDYAINVVSGGPADSYTLFIEILPLGAKPDEQAQQNNVNRAAFRNALVSLLTATPPGYDALQTMMHDPFTIAGWGAESQSLTPAEAIEQLRSSTLPPSAQLTYEPDVDFGILLGGANLGDLFPQVGGGDALFLVGWGADGNGEAIVIVGLDNNGVFTWDAVLIAPSGF